MPKKGTTDLPKKQGATRFSDPDIIVFYGDESLPEGSVERHGLSALSSSLFGKKKEDVQADWEKVLGQMKFLVDKAASYAGDFALDEITFQLGFSAEGSFVFVAKAGVQATVSAKFKRKI
jgi:hypothetical protein